MTAAVLAAGGSQLRTLALALAVLVTVTVYWVAESYAEFGEQAYEGKLPTWAQTRSSMAANWRAIRSCSALSKRARNTTMALARF